MNSLQLLLAVALTGLTASRADAAPASPAAHPTAVRTTPNQGFNALPASQRSAIHARTDEAFWKKHPELNGSRLGADADPRIIKEYMALRREITEASVGRSVPSAGGSAAGAGRPAGAASNSPGLVNPQQMAARAQSMMSEMERLVSEYENASPARQTQIRARMQALSNEAIQLREQALALARSAWASGQSAVPPIPGGGTGLAPSAGTVGPDGKLTPASFLATGPEQYLATLAAEREKKACVRAEQERIYYEGAKMQTTYLNEGTADFNKATARAGLDVFNGGARVGMAFAPEWLYQGFEGLNSAAESINSAKDGAPWDTAKGAQSTVAGFKEAGDELFEGTALPKGSKPTRFDQLGRGMEVVDLVVNANDFAKAGSKSDTLEQTKEGLAMASNVASLAGEVKKYEHGAGIASRIVSGASGALAAGEGVHNINQTLDERAAFAQSANTRIQDANAQARAAAERARANQELANFLRDLEVRARHEQQSVVPPSQNQNQEYFRIP
jgi:hypothetical protein